MGIKSAFRPALIGAFVAIGLAFAGLGISGPAMAQTDLTCTSMTATTCTISATETHDAATDTVWTVPVANLEITGTLEFTGGAGHTLTVNGNLTIANGGKIDAEGATMAQTGENGRDLTINVDGVAMIDGVVSTKGRNGAGNTNPTNNGGDAGDQTWDVAGDFTLGATGLLELKPGNGTGSSGTDGTPGVLLLDQVGGNATIDGKVNTEGGDATMIVVGTLDIYTTGLVETKGAVNDDGGVFLATVDGAIVVDGVVDAKGGGGNPSGNGADVTLSACGPIDVVGVSDEEEDIALITAAGGGSTGDGAAILLHAGGDITVGPNAEFDATGDPNGSITLTTAGAVIDTATVFNPMETRNEGSPAPIHCPLDDFAKISGGINFGAGPGNSPEYTFDGIVSNGPDGPGSIEINYRLLGPTQCTFTRNALIVYDGDKSATFEADYDCVNGDKDGQMGTATLTLVDRDEAPPRGAIKVDADDDDLDIDDGGNPFALETGNVIIDGGV